MVRLVMSPRDMSETVFLFLKGLLLGLSIAAPVGPIGLLCIRRSLEAEIGRAHV